MAVVEQLEDRAHHLCRRKLSRRLFGLNQHGHQIVLPWLGAALRGQFLQHDENGAGGRQEFGRPFRAGRKVADQKQRAGKVLANLVLLRVHAQQSANRDAADNRQRKIGHTVERAATPGDHVQPVVHRLADHRVQTLDPRRQEERIDQAAHAVVIRAIGLAHVADAVEDIEPFKAGGLGHLR